MIKKGFKREREFNEGAGRKSRENVVDRREKDEKNMERC